MMNSSRKLTMFYSKSCSFSHLIYWDMNLFVTSYIPHWEKWSINDEWIEKTHNWLDLGLQTLCRKALLIYVYQLYHDIEFCCWDMAWMMVWTNHSLTGMTRFTYVFSVVRNKKPSLISLNCKHSLDWCFICHWNQTFVVWWEICSQFDNE